MSDVAARNKRNRRAGAKWQSDIRDNLRAAGFDIERLALTGQEDEGDHVVRLQSSGIWVPPKYVVLEAKAGEMHPAQFVREAELEAKHYAEHRDIDPTRVMGIAVVKQRGKNWKDAYVLTTMRAFFQLEGRS